MKSASPVLVHVTTTDISLELLLGSQLEAFREAGYDVVGVSAPGPYVESLVRRGIRHMPLAHATRTRAPLEDLRATAELVSLFRRLRPMIVHTHNPKPGVYGRLAARLAHVPVVVNTVHGLYAQPSDPAPKRAFVYTLERVAAVWSDVNLVQNPEDLELLRRLRIPADELELLGNGIDLGRFDPGRVTSAEQRRAREELGARGPDDVVVGFVGRLVREKGYQEVFEAARLLRARFPQVRVAVVGGDDADKADALDPVDLAHAREAGVQLLGPRDDVVRLYAGMDVYGLASHREGFPRSAMEAAAMGLPIVVTDIRGCREVVDHGVTGFLVPARDPRALADAIVTLAADAGARRRMGDAAHVKALRDFDQQRCIDITLEAYRRLLDAHGTRLLARRP